MLLAGLGVMLFAAAAPAGAEEKAVHPELTAQEQLIDCAECHRSATPEVEKDWHDSLHGIGMVKCYQCHGTFGDFMVTPTRENCAVCHADKLENHAEKLGKAKETACWECHVPHSFKVKK